jgi:hypothetical protein
LIGEWIMAFSDLMLVLAGVAALLGMWGAAVALGAVAVVAGWWLGL